MTEFPLDIVTPDGEIFSGRAESLRLRSIEGDLCIRARHTDYVTALGMGPAEVITAGNKHIAACMGGMVSVLGGRVTLTATTFEWAEDIDTDRSHASEERAREKLGHGDLTDTEPQILPPPAIAVGGGFGVPGGEEVYRRPVGFLRSYSRRCWVSESSASLSMSFTVPETSTRWPLL